MSSDPAAPGPEASREELLAAGEALRRRVAELEQEKRDLEVMLETAAEHADHVSEALETERNDLATMLEMTTEHADTVEDELHERAAAALLKSAQELRMIVEATPAPVIIVRLADGEIVYVNAMMGALFRTDASDMIGRNAVDLYYDAAERESVIRTLREERSVDRQEVRFKRYDGTLIWVEISLRILDFNDEPSVLSALHDITARKEDEQRLQQQVEALRLELEETSSHAELARSTGTTRFENLDAAVVRRGSTDLVAVHSFRGGNGKSSIAANVAVLLAAAGQRVGLLDADLQSPGVHLLLGQSGKDLGHTLDDFLLGNCRIDELAIDVTGKLGQHVDGKLFLIPASVNPGTMAQILSQGYDAQRLTQSLYELGELLGLDTLLIDTHPGLNEEALLIMRAVQTLVVVLRPDKQDFEGTGVTVQVARQLEVPRILLVANQIAQTSQLHAVRSRMQKTFNCEVAAVIPHSTELMSFEEEGAFVLRHPDHPVTMALQLVAQATKGATVRGQAPRDAAQQ
jgi:PAS domain S-box-containing protein